MKLALQRYFRDWLFSLNSVLAMAAYLAPLLAVMGIQDGMVGTMVSRLASNPRHLVLEPKIFPGFPLEFFEKLRADPDVVFIAPHTRFNSLQVKLTRDGGDYLDVSVIPTGANDPLRAFSDAEEDISAPVGLTDVYLGARVSERLKLKKGGSATMRFSRAGSGKPVETADVPVRVKGVLPLNILSDMSVFASQELTEMIEDYKDLFAVEKLDLPGNPKTSPRRSYYSFRLNAKDFDAVERLRQKLEAGGLELKTRSREIADMKFMDRAFTAVFLTLLSVVGLGALLSAALNSVDQVAKNRRSLACLSLLGLPRSHLLIFSSFQSAVTGFFASIGAVSLYLAVEATLNNYFLEAEHALSRNIGGFNKVCHLSWEKLLSSSGVVILAMILASFAAYSAIASIEPSEGMRDV
ncbi:MAG: hypothetical protein LBR53_05030 [Deltaproteobacteria bacterium]|nr:hypothetical protein [Deltaproteobacteria bacterium]